MTTPNFHILDHPTFHPERTVANHIALVSIRALVLTREVDLVLAALFHDWFKPQGRPKQVGDTFYISNPDHAKQAALFVLQDEQRYFISQMGGNAQTVSDLCRYHMVKDGPCKASKKVPHMATFLALDDMVFRRTLPQRGKVTFAGQSPIQQHFQNGMFTITESGTPCTYRIEDIPDFFTGRFSPVGDILRNILSH